MKVRKLYALISFGICALVICGIAYGIGKWDMKDSQNISKDSNIETSYMNGVANEGTSQKEGEDSKETGAKDFKDIEVVEKAMYAYMIGYKDSLMDLYEQKEEINDTTKATKIATGKEITMGELATLYHLAYKEFMESDVEQQQKDKATDVYNKIAEYRTTIESDKAEVEKEVIMKSNEVFKGLEDNYSELSNEDIDLINQYTEFIMNKFNSDSSLDK